MCASALVEEDSLAASQWLVDALDVAASEDDGSIIAGIVVNAHVRLVLLATQRLAERPDFTRDRLTCELAPWLRELMVPRDIAARVTHEAVLFADRGGHRACSTKSVEGLRCFLEALEPLVAGREVQSVPETALEGLAAPFSGFAAVLRPAFLQSMRHDLRF